MIEQVLKVSISWLFFYGLVIYPLHVSRGKTRLTLWLLQLLMLLMYPLLGKKDHYTGLEQIIFIAPAVAWITLTAYAISTPTEDMIIKLVKKLRAVKHEKAA